MYFRLPFEHLVYLLDKLLCILLYKYSKFILTKNYCFLSADYSKIAIKNYWKSNNLILNKPLPFEGLGFRMIGTLE